MKEPLQKAFKRRYCTNNAVAKNPSSWNELKTLAEGQRACLSLGAIQRSALSLPRGLAEVFLRRLAAADPPQMIAGLSYLLCLFVLLPLALAKTWYGVFLLSPRC